ncbi:unnamed protein product [Dracunculus medinensis]|uniref:glucuronosyltransferase n=1 Tax=Dracunculus medinensis TaxID=318479 RepID=A0A0N4ULX4_DRAME|nr:unnamed protein product [Dracunculus medinensis]
MSHIADELVKRKHSVTWLEFGYEKSNFELNHGVNEIFWYVNRRGSKQDNRFYRNISIDELVWRTDFMNDAEKISAWLTSIEICDRILSHRKSEFDELVIQKFDVVIVDDLYNPCGLLLVGLKKSTFIYWSLTSFRTETAWANQSPFPPSYLPVPGTGLTDDMNMLERIYNLAAYWRTIYVHHHIILPRVDVIFQKYYPESVPNAFFIERNASINFINTPLVFDFARPYMPRVIFVGAIHCREPQSLEGALSEFVDGADDANGVVLFTSGFSIEWKRAPANIINAFVNAFRIMNATRFVWQYNGWPIKNLPKNVLILDWVPQQDLLEKMFFLGHPKVKAHITHGGLNSVIESVWHGVPIIGIPFTISAYDNIIRLTSRAVGILLSKKDLRVELIIKALKQIRHPRYMKEMNVFRDMVVDVPYTELNHSTFWVEFIERHQEVPHARSGADELNILQYFLVDVVQLKICLSKEALIKKKHN